MIRSPTSYVLTGDIPINEIVVYKGLMDTVVSVGTGVQATVVYAAAARDDRGVATIVLLCAVPDGLDASFTTGGGLVLIVSDVGPPAGDSIIMTLYSCDVLSRPANSHVQGTLIVGKYLLNVAGQHSH